MNILVIYPNHSRAREALSAALEGTKITAIAKDDLVDKIRGMEFQAVIGLEFLNSEERLTVLSRVR